jgi:hypothetical protein
MNWLRLLSRWFIARCSVLLGQIPYPLSGLDLIRVSDLSADALVGDAWRRNPIRYIDAQRESYLDELIRGHRPEIQTSTTDRTLSIKVKGHIYEKLESIASAEGRSLEDIIRKQ